MFSIKESVKYGFEKFKENIGLSLLTTLFLIGASSLSIEDSGAPVFFFNLALAVLLLILRIGYTKIFLRIHEGEKPKFSDIFEEYKLFFPYLGVTILTFIATVGGLILLIIPGVFWGIRFSLSPVILIDKKIGPILAMKESYAMTKGIFWKLFSFWIVIALLNLAGLAVLFIGLLVTMPISTLATIHVYKALSKRITIANTTVVTP